MLNGYFQRVPIEALLAIHNSGQLLMCRNCCNLHVINVARFALINLSTVQRVVGLLIGRFLVVNQLSMSNDYYLRSWSYDRTFPVRTLLRGLCTLPRVEPIVGKNAELALEPLFSYELLLVVVRFNSFEFV